jgi:predicted amidohydrolase
MSSFTGACRQFAPLIEEAARRKADLVVLGETLTYAGVNST